MSKHHLFVISFVLLFAFACGSITNDRVSDVVEPTAQSKKVEADPTESAETGEQVEDETESVETDEQAENADKAEAESVETDEQVEDAGEAEVEDVESVETDEQVENQGEAESAEQDEDAAEVEPLVVIKSGFGQDDQEVGFGLIIQNPNSTHAFQNVPVQIILYNDEGTVLETSSNYIDMILPGQTFGFGGSLYLGEEMTPSEMEVNLEGDSSYAVLAESMLELETNSEKYISDEILSSVTGEISNPYDEDLEDVRVSVITYDEDGEINGGGSARTRFILANSTTGASVIVTSSGEPATVEMYPSISQPTFDESDNMVPENAQKINLIKSGHGQDGITVGYSFIVENPNEGLYVKDTQYRVTAYDSEGFVLAVDDNFLELLLPGQTLGVAGETYSEEPVERIEIQMLSGELSESSSSPLFTSENVEYKPDDFFPEVTGEIVSTYANDVTEVKVFAIAYDDGGEIVGSGYEYLELVPANGKTAVNVGMTMYGVPDNIELYATVSGLSEF